METWSLEKIREYKTQIKKVFFMRVCGTGMGAAACLLQELGIEVHGWDSQYYPPMSDYLKKAEISLINDELEKIDLSSFDLIVVGNVVGRNSSEAKYIESLKIPLASFPAVIGGLVLYDKEVIGVAGTHGKTTTTYFMAQMLEALGEDPGYFIGAVLPDRPPSKLGRKYFCIESDEYDSAYFEKFSKFKSYCLDHMIITSLEFDHADIFADIEAIKNEFYPVTSTLKGELVANEKYSEIEILLKDRIWFPYTKTFVYKPVEGGSFLKLTINKKEYSLETNVTGEHNCENLVGIIHLFFRLGFKIEDVFASCRYLKMPARRQQERGLLNGALVIDDFAHHPTAIEKTLAALKNKYQRKKIFVVMEPNSATGRSDLFQSEYPKSLDLVDSLIIAKPEKATTVKMHENLNSEQVLVDWKSIGSDKNGWVATSSSEIREILKDNVSSEYIVVILSNGTCLGLWKEDFLDETF